MVNAHLDNWLIKLGKVKPGGCLNFVWRGAIDWQAIYDAVEMQYPGRRDLVFSSHGSRVYIDVRDGE